MTTAAQISPSDRRFRGIRRYWRSFLKFAGAELEDYAATFTVEWPTFLATSLVVSMLVVGSLHTLELFGLRATGSVALESLALVPAGSLGAVLIALLGWAYWRIRLDPSKLGPYVVALLAFAIAIGVCVEAFAGVTALHLQGREPGSGLWAMEQAYTWHVLDAIPLLGLPGTLGWDQPAAGHDHVSGTLLLVFNLAVIVPVLRLGVSGYYSIERHVSDAKKRRRLEESEGLVHRFDQVLESGDLLLIAPVLALGAAGIYVLWTLLFDPSSWPTRSLDRLIPDGVHLRGIRVPLDWAATVPQWLGVAAILFVLFWVLVGVLELEPRPATVRAVAAACGAYACVLMLMTEGAVALLLALSHVGAISTQPPIPAHDQLGAAFSFIVRPVADAVPGLNIPETLHWSTEDRFVGGAGGVLQLVYKFGFFLIVLFPVARTIRSYSQESAPVAVPQATLTAARRFVDAYGEARVALDEAERAVLQERSSPGGRHTSLRLGDQQTIGWPGEPLSPASQSSLEAARDHLRALVRLLEDVKALFGAGPESGHAEEVLRTAAARLRLIDDAQPSRFGRRLANPDEEGVRAGLSEAKRASEAAARAYVKAARGALRGGVPVG